MNSSVRYKYQQRAEIIREAAVIYESFGLQESYSTFILQANTGSDETGGEWTGFVQTLKGFIKKENAKIVSKQEKQNAKQEEQTNLIFEELKEIKALLNKDEEWII